MRLKLLGATVLSLGLLAGACANASAGGRRRRRRDGGASGTSYPTCEPTRSSCGSSRAAASWLPQYTLTTMPLFSLFGDGLVVTPGVQTEIYPGPALPALSQERSSDAIQQLLQAALDAGFNTDRSYGLGSVGISDASTTMFTLTVDGQTHTTKVYALDASSAPSPRRCSQEEFRRAKPLRVPEEGDRSPLGSPRARSRIKGLYNAHGLATVRQRLPGGPQPHGAPGRMAAYARAWPRSAIPVQRVDRNADAVRRGRRRRRDDMLAAGRTGEPAHAVDERGSQYGTPVPAFAARRVRLLRSFATGRSAPSAPIAPNTLRHSHAFRALVQATDSGGRYPSQNYLEAGSP